MNTHEMLTHLTGNGGENLMLVLTPVALDQKHRVRKRFEPGLYIYADFGRYSTAWGLSIQAGIADSAVNPPVRLPKRANLGRADSKTINPGRFRAAPTPFPGRSQQVFCLMATLSTLDHPGLEIVA